MTDEPASRKRRRRRAGPSALREQRRAAARHRAHAPGTGKALAKQAGSSKALEKGTKNGRSLIIACGALARDILFLIRQHRDHIDLHCLPAEWHNTPQRIPEGVRARIRQAREEGYARIFVAYGDCGTGGALDAVLAEEGGISRLPGPHCYAFYTGVENFMRHLERDARSYFLTDYLVRHFDSLIVKGLKLDTHPELIETCFGNYDTLVHLAQDDDPALTRKAQEAARFLNLTYERRYVGHGDLATAIERFAGEISSKAEE